MTRYMPLLCLGMGLSVLVVGSTSQPAQANCLRDLSAQVCQSLEALEQMSIESENHQDCRT